MLIGKEAICDFNTIQEAVDYVERFKDPDEHLTLTILEGVYKEQVTIRRSHLTLRGLGHVVISNQAYAKQKNEQGNEIGTFATATLYLDGVDVHLENLTIENTAGQGDIVGQAVALYANCDLSTFKYCRFKGYQDTLFTSCLPDKQKDGTSFPVKRPVHAQYRQYYFNCSIEGTVDYIFGGATAYFDQCLLVNKAREKEASGYMTAANTPSDQPYGFIFNECVVLSEEGAAPVYLGRPWRPYANVLFQHCKMDDNIHQERWHDWNNSENRLTAIFQEIDTQQVGMTETISKGWGVKKHLKPEKTVTLQDVFLEAFY